MYKILFLFFFVLFFQELMCQNPDSLIFYEEEVSIDELLNEHIQRYKTTVDGCNLYKKGKANFYRRGVECNGNEILPAIFDMSGTELGPKIIMRLGENSGLFDLEKQAWTIPMERVSIQRLDNGYYILRSQSKGDKMTDSNGNTLIEPERKTRIIPPDGNKECIILKKNPTESLYSLYYIPQNKIILDPEYLKIATVPNQLNFIISKDLKNYFLYNLTTGKTSKTSYQFLDVLSAKELLAKKKGVYGIIDTNEKILIPFKYKSLKEIKFDSKKYFMVENKNGQFDIIDENNTKLNNTSFDEIFDPVDNLVKVRIGDQYWIYYMNEKFSPYIDKGYDDIELTYNKIRLSKNGKHNLMKYRKGIQIPVELPYSDFRYNWIKSYATLNDSVIVFNSDVYTVVKRTPYKEIKEVNRIDPYGKQHRMYHAIDHSEKHWLLDLKFNKLLDRSFHDIIGYYNDLIFFGDKAGLIGIFNTTSKKEVAEPQFDNIFINGKKPILSKGLKFYELTARGFLQL